MPNSPNRAQKIETVRIMYASGSSCKQIAQAIGVKSNRISELAAQAGLPRRRPRLSDERIQEIGDLADALTVREIAKRAKCSRGTAGNYVIWWREREAERNGELAVRRLNRPRVCATHGRIRIWPCVACAAQAALDAIAENGHRQDSPEHE